MGSVGLLVTLAEAAELFGVTEKALRDWIAEGMPVSSKGSRGGGKRRDRTMLDLRDCVAWYFAEKAFDDQRQRLAAAQAEKVEHENAVRRGELARMGDVMKFWTDCIAAARARLLALPSRIAAGLPAEIRQDVLANARELVHEALSELAEYEPGE